MEKHCVVLIALIYLVCTAEASKSPGEVDLTKALKNRHLIEVKDKKVSRSFQDGTFLALAIDIKSPFKDTPIVVGFYNGIASAERKFFEIAINGHKGKVLLKYRANDDEDDAMNVATFRNIWLFDNEWHTIIMHLHILPETNSVKASLVVDCVAQARQHISPWMSESSFSSSNETKTFVKFGRRRSVNLKGHVRRAILVTDQTLPYMQRNYMKDCYEGDIPNLPLEEALRMINKFEPMSELIAQISDLSSVMRELYRDLKLHIAETRELRKTMQSCSLCGTVSGVRSTSKTTCKDKPCHDGVKCHDSVDGFVCGECPMGSEGNGTICEDINMCEAVRPCSELTTCENTVDGFSCAACPTGYEETFEKAAVHGSSYDKQVCVDVDECLVNNGGCAKYSRCNNIAGSFSCGDCIKGYAGNQIQGCRAIRHCSDGEINPCHLHASCEVIDKNRGGVEYSCFCDVGYAGNGYVCGKDSDHDGVPDEEISCEDKSCRQDNCPTVPNSGQEDSDNDEEGDKCDEDADNDGISNMEDNCVLVSNPDQQNSDMDWLGDACDNCPNIKNPNQEDTDGNGEGDTCDDDIDGDGITNYADNCPTVPNYQQADTDNDGVGDSCDNCPAVSNPLQVDSDDDLLGDMCDDDADADGDGHQNNVDNCPYVINSAQLDTDNDGQGDACDDDDDDDGVLDYGIGAVADNCRLIYNPSQLDRDEDGIGDACETDQDGDLVKDWRDACPENADVTTTDFRTYQSVVLDPQGDAQVDPYWIVLNQGREIIQTQNSDPGLAIGFDSFDGVDFSGTFFVNTATDDDYAGFIFSYQNSARFYVVTWKQTEQTYWKPTPFRAVARPGLQLKVVNSQKGPGERMRNALWHSYDTPGEVKVLWSDPIKQGWKDKTSYRWELQHRPKVGYIRIIFFHQTEIIADTGVIRDTTIQGGRLGVFCFSQENVIWSNLMYRCNDTQPDSERDSLN
ncbi:unnamed protein product [Clavelina lepadiformis]|uniref:Uncharacterized protein n=1 Tax=Clavelina lepadiformis TaxID=159417 RepID=A0ABP0GM78_CLALP